MLVQAGLCQTCSETTLLVFPRGGSFVLRFVTIEEVGKEDKGNIEDLQMNQHRSTGPQQQEYTAYNGLLYDVIKMGLTEVKGNRHLDSREIEHNPESSYWSGF